MENLKITSLKELQLRVPRILQEYGDNQELLLTALANPLIALEQIGITFTESAIEEIKNHIRFGKQGAFRINQLKESIFKLAEHNFNLDSPTEAKKSLAIVLSEKDSTAKTAKKSLVHETHDMRITGILESYDKPIVKKDNRFIDPLSEFKNEHPIIELLLEYRKLNSVHIPLAEKVDLQKILAKKDIIPLKNIRFRLSKKNK